MFTRSSTPELPVEVCERIIDNASIGTAKRCSQVCHSWLPRSRVIIFETVSLNSSSMASKLISLLSRSPSIGYYVCVLRISGPSESRRWLHDVVHTLPPLLPNVHTLSLYELPHLDLDFYTSVSQFTKVKSLELVLLRVHSIRELIQIVNGFENLRNLHIHSRHISSLDIHPNDNIRSHKLEAFKLLGYRQNQLDRFFNWIVESNSFQSLSTLDLNIDGYTGKLNRLLHESSKTLQSLRFKFVMNGSIVFKKLPALTTFHALRFLSLKLYSASNGVSVILPKLAQGVPESFELLQLRYECRIGDLLREDSQGEWLAFDQFLSSLNLSKPPSLEIECVSGIPGIDPDTLEDGEEDDLGCIAEGVGQKQQEENVKNELVGLDRDGLFRRHLPNMYERGLSWFIIGWGTRSYLVSPTEPEKWRSRATGSFPFF
ncbi:hypothetical protein NLI96_g2192 [Meripilus lineatus]|uniref:F-box domain-containing protein n=1 Tax=Meripilus lineatus TaxID=2056292 RepID=A0AAD5V981_9APHY|nr:hypothetical protein NLI96_g2192 [Physisporinus lineatus]